MQFFFIIQCYTILKCIFQYPCYHDFYFIIVLFFNCSFSSFISIWILCTIVYRHANTRKQNTCKQNKILYFSYLWCWLVSVTYNPFSIICTDHLNVLLPLEDFISAFYSPLYEQKHFSSDYAASSQARNIKFFLNVFPHEKSSYSTSLP